MAKKIIVDGIEIIPNIKLCSGCENITCGCPTGWECMYHPENNECEYPQSILAHLNAAKQAVAGDAKSEVVKQETGA
jgi:hypothetical protein